MRRLVLVWFVTGIFSASVLAQNSSLDTKQTPTFNFKSVGYLTLSSSMISSEDVLKFEKQLDAYLELLKDKKSRIKSEKKYLEYVFFKTHKDFLKTYEKYSDFSKMLSSGKYDCLSGSLLFAYLLDRLDYQYTINETLYHVYLTVQTENGLYLFESTDPLKGFVSSSKEIENRINFYTSGQSLSSNINMEGVSSNEYQFQSKAIAQIGLKEAGALQFYNTAIVDYNNRKLTEAYSKLEKALLYYPSERIEEMLAVVLQSIAQFDGLSNEEKCHFISKFNSRNTSKALVAF